MMIANKQALVQEDGGDLTFLQGVSEELKSDRGIGVSGETEVFAKAFRRHFTAEYKRDILKKADTCTEGGSLGALLRREGLYSSNITTWRRQRDRSILSGLTPKKRGRKESVRHPLSAEMTTLRQENDRLTKRLKWAEMIIDVQKKYQRYWVPAPDSIASLLGNRRLPFYRGSARARNAPYLPRNFWRRPPIRSGRGYYQTLGPR